MCCALARGGTVAQGPRFPCDVRTPLSLDQGDVSWDSYGFPAFLYETVPVDAGRSTLFLFAVNTGTSATEKGISGGRFCTATLFSFQIYERSTLVRDYVPARRVADGVVGLWERKYNAFYPNCGTGTFVAGPVVGSAHPYGELHIDVPAGVTLTNAVTRIEGAVKVVKEGGGTFCSSSESPFRAGCGGK